MELVKACPVCGAEEFETLMQLEYHEFVRKCHCGMYFLSPRMDEKELHDFYSDGDFEQAYRTFDNHARKSRNRAIMRYQQIRKYLHGVRSVLDIGCSDGGFLACLPERIERDGIDPTATDYIRGYFPEDMPNKKYDMITCFHVVEHVCDPMKLIGSVKNYLNDGGLFVLEYPDIEILLGRKEPYLCFHRAHIYDFSVKTITVLLNRCGFKITKIGSYHAGDDADKNVMVICEVA